MPWRQNWRQRAALRPVVRAAAAAAERQAAEDEAAQLAVLDLKIQYSFHEAGHAVAARCLGLGVFELGANAAGGFFRRTAPQPTDRDDLIMPAVRSALQSEFAGEVAAFSESVLIMFSAGRAGQQLFLPTADPSSWREDDQRRKGTARALHPNDERACDALLERMAARADAIVFQYRGAIETLAVACLRCGRLDAAEIISVLDEHRVPDGPSAPKAQSKRRLVTNGMGRALGEIEVDDSGGAQAFRRIGDELVPIGHFPDQGRLHERFDISTPRRAW